MTAYEVRISDWSSDVCSFRSSAARAATLSLRRRKRRRQRSPGDRRLDILDRHREKRAEIFLCVRNLVIGQDMIGKVAQRAIGRKRLGRKHVERDCAKMLDDRGVGMRGFIDNPAAREIDQYRARKSGRAHACTPGPNATPVCRSRLETT